jgi:hypothetical protein
VPGAINGALAAPRVLQCPTTVRDLAVYQAGTLSRWFSGFHL